MSYLQTLQLYGGAKLLGWILWAIWDHFEEDSLGWWILGFISTPLVALQLMCVAYAIGLFCVGVVGGLLQ